MPTKLATLGLPKTTVFWIKGYDVIIYVHDVTSKLLSRDSNVLYMQLCDQSLASVAFLWKKLSQPQFGKDLTRKTNFSEGC